MGISLGGGGLSSIINPADTAINKITGRDNAANYLDPMSLTSSGTKRVVKWLGKEAVMPVNEGKWWIDTLQGKNGNNLGSIFASHDALHASSTKELNNDNWFANHPDETAAMVWSAGLASGAFGGGAAAAGGGAAGGADAAGEEAALAGGASGGYGAGDAAVIGSGAADTSGLVAGGGGSAAGEEAALAGNSSIGYGAGDLSTAGSEEAALAGNSSIGYGSSEASGEGGSPFSNFLQNQIKSRARSYATNQLMHAFMGPQSQGGSGGGSMGVYPGAMGGLAPAGTQIQSPNIMPLFSSAAQNQPAYTTEYSNAQNVDKLAKALRGTNGNDSQPD